MLVSAQIYDKCLHARWSGPSCIPRRSARISWRWSPALATLQTIDEEEIVDRARRPARLQKGARPAGREYELFHEVRGKGLMIGLVFGEPTSLRIAWSLEDDGRPPARGSSPS